MPRPLQRMSLLARRRAAVHGWKMTKITEKFSFLRGYVLASDRIFFSAEHDEAVAKDVASGVLYTWRRNEWVYHLVEWSAVGVCAIERPSRTVFMLGREGAVLTWGAAGFDEEQIREDNHSPQMRGPLRDIRVIEQEVFAVGMGRQVYRWLGPGNWVRFELGLPETRARGSIVGLNGISGVSVDNLYAVGWGGEIWRTDGERWRAVSSPTNVGLFDVQVISDKLAYACGQAGTLLRGIGDQWEAIEYKSNQEIGEFRSMAWFKDRLYLTDGDLLYSLVDDVVTRVDMGFGEDVPTGYIHASQDLLLSVAPKDLFMTSNGAKWDEIPT